MCVRFVFRCTLTVDLDASSLLLRAYNPPPEVLKLREASDKLLQSVHVKVPVALFLRGFVGEFSLLGHRIVEKFEQVNFILAN